MARLSDADVALALGALPDWQREGNMLVREYRFLDFRAVMWFVNAVATIADAFDHHPQWTNVYNRVSVRLTTHDAGGITEQDITLALGMDEAAR